MNPITIEIATTIRSIIPTIAMKGFNEYKADKIITPTTIIIMERTIPRTACGKSPLISFSPYALLFPNRPFYQKSFFSSLTPLQSFLILKSMLAFWFYG